MHGHAGSAALVDTPVALLRRTVGLFKHPNSGAPIEGPGFLRPPLSRKLPLQPPRDRSLRPGSA